MLRKLGYYIAFILLIALFGFSGLSDFLDYKTLYVICGILFVICFAAALWKTRKINREERYKKDE